MSTTQKLLPIIAAGGQGLRMYPLSFGDQPKQFIRLGNKGTLLEITLKRVSAIMEQCKSRNYHVLEPLLIMHHTHKLPSELSHHESNVVYELYGNDTAVAVANAIVEIKKRYNDESITMLFLPADHYIYNEDAFVKDITDGLDHITHDNIVLYGIHPTSPDTKYGYIIPSDNGIIFKEKPNIEQAQGFIAQNALWNSGIFAARSDRIYQCLTTYKYDIMDWVNNPREGKAPSFDIAILQEHANIYAHKCFDWKWADIGTWKSFIEVPEIIDEMAQSRVITADCTHINVLNRNSSNIVIIGCHDLLVVTNDNHILIMPTTGDYSNQLKAIATITSMNI